MSVVLYLSVFVFFFLGGERGKYWIFRSDINSFFSYRRPNRHSETTSVVGFTFGSAVIIRICESYTRRQRYGLARIARTSPTVLNSPHADHFRNRIQRGKYLQVIFFFCFLIFLGATKPVLPPRIPQRTHYASGRFNGCIVTRQLAVYRGGHCPARTSEKYVLYPWTGKGCRCVWN